MTQFNPNDLPARLAAFLTASAGAPAAIAALKPIAGGASRETWAVDAEIGGVRHALSSLVRCLLVTSSLQGVGKCSS